MRVDLRVQHWNEGMDHWQGHIVAAIGICSFIWILMESVINSTPLFKGLTARIPIIFPIKGRINQGST